MSRRSFLAVLAGTGLAIAACSDPKPPPPAEAPRPVKVVRVSGGDGAAPTVIGRVRAQRRAVLSFQVGGRVTAISAQVGDPVTRGDVLARLDGSHYALRAAQADAETARARAEAARAQGDYTRKRILFDKGYLAPAALDGVRAEAEAAASVVHAVDAAAQIARRDVTNTVLTAPFDGRVAARPVEPFTDVGAGAPVLEIEDDSAAEVLVPVPLDWARGLAPGAVVAIVSNEQTVPGVIRQVSTRATAGGVVEVIVTPEPGRSLASGDAVQVRFPSLSAGDEALRLPPTAVLVGEHPEIGHVFVVDASARVEKRPVRFRLATDGRLVILAGLRRGEVVVAAGAAFLNAGQVVRPRPAAA